METIGVIGLGIMGKPMARNLMKAGFPVIVWNRTASKAAELAQEGALAAASPRDVARQAAIVITMVSDSPDVEEVVLGAEGVVHGIHAGSVAVDMSTIAPSAARRIAAKLAEKGVAFLDAPVSGGEWGAVNATLSIMAGGDRAAFDRCHPVFEALGKRIVYCGGSGMGQVTKAVNQIIGAGTLAAVAEGLVFAAKAGADLNAVHRAVTGGAANSVQLENLGARILKGDFAPGFKVKLQQKDLRIVLETARDMQLPLFTTPLVHQLFQAAERQGLGDAGTQAYIRVLEGLAGTEARAPENKG